jgi:hypothetical protein
MGPRRSASRAVHPGMVVDGDTQEQCDLTTGDEAAFITMKAGLVQGRGLEQAIHRGPITAIRHGDTDGQPGDRT